MKPKRIALLGLLTAIALTIFMIEAQIPPIVPLPGVKLGLSNIVTVFTVFAIGATDGLLVLAARVFLGAVFAGNFSSILYSAAGGLCAILVTIGLKRILTTKQLWAAGMLGAMAHSCGQVAVAMLVTGTPKVIFYLPALLAISVVTGLFTGLSAQYLVNHGGKLWETFLK